MHLYYTEYSSPIGVLILGAFDNKLCVCDWKFRKKRNSIDARINQYLEIDEWIRDPENSILINAIEQLEQFFAGDRKYFDIALNLVGSKFQRSVWTELMAIPFGETISYLELSKRVGNQNQIRAVANANGSNAMSIIIPCHRVVGKNGSLVGYAGGLYAKQNLLELESSGLRQLNLFGT